MTPDSPPLLESPERLIRRLAADLARRDREEWNAKVKAEKRRTWLDAGAGRDRQNFGNYNYKRRVLGRPEISFEEYLATVKGARKGGSKARPKEVLTGEDLDRKRWASNETYRKSKGLPPRSFDTYLAQRKGSSGTREARGWSTSKAAYHQNNYARRKKGLPGISYQTFVEERMARNLGTPIDKETVAAREARYQRLKERLKTLPKGNESRASVLGIKTPRQMKEETGENDSIERHILSKMVRQEGACHFPSRTSRWLGWHSIGEGCFRKGHGRG